MAISRKIFKVQKRCHTWHHRVLGPKFTYQKNPRKLKHVFFGVKLYGEQHLLNVFCPWWENPANLFEKKPIGLLNKVLEGGYLEKSLLNKKHGKYPF